jgi:hypothetical protein
LIQTYIHSTTSSSGYASEQNARFQRVYRIRDPRAGKSCRHGTKILPGKSKTSKAGTTKRAEAKG